MLPYDNMCLDATNAMFLQTNDMLRISTQEGAASKFFRELGPDLERFGAVVVPLVERFEGFVLPALVNLEQAGPEGRRLEFLVGISDGFADPLWPPSMSSFDSEVHGTIARLLRYQSDRKGRVVLFVDPHNTRGFPVEFCQGDDGIHFTDPNTEVRYSNFPDVCVDALKSAVNSVSVECPEVVVVRGAYPNSREGSPA